jgi:PPOX class probable FMN-dependent enzyme
MASFGHLLTSEAELRAILGTPGPRAIQKQQSALDAHSRAFIAHSPFVLVATSDQDGRCDVSPKGDAPGFVKALDDHRLVIPDRPGNRRVDGMRNMLTNPRVGLIFLVPGRQETLRVNGRACITRDPALLELCAAQGRTPALAIGVDVEECFMHCAKAFLRSRLWTPDTWPAPDALASLGCVLFDQIKPAGVTAQDYERDLSDGYKKLY